MDEQPINVKPYVIASCVLAIIFSLAAFWILMSSIIQTTKDSVSTNSLNTETLEYNAAV